MLKVTYHPLKVKILHRMNLLYRALKVNRNLVDDDKKSLNNDSRKDYFHICHLTQDVPWNCRRFHDVSHQLLCFLKAHDIGCYAL